MLTRAIILTILITMSISMASCTRDLFIVDIPDYDIENPLLRSWTGSYGGAPDFNSMDLSKLTPAIRDAMDIYKEEIEKISNQDAAPTFENTIAALESTGKVLERVYAYYGIWSSNLSSPEFRKIKGQLAPELSEFYSKIKQNDLLFSRIRAVYDERHKGGLRPDQKRLVELIHDSFARNGATLADSDKDKYTQINRRLAELYSLFSNNVLADEENYVTLISEAQLDGLPDSYIAAAAEAAAKRGNMGFYAVTNTRSSMEPFLTYSEHRGLREKVWRDYYGRGDNGDDFDNHSIIAEILNLRHERSVLLGYNNYAEWKLENLMAQRPQKAQKLLMLVWPAALERVMEEVADMQAVADRDGAGIRIKPWDYRFYSEKVRKERFRLDSDELREYLQLEKLIEAMLYVAEKVFNFDFIPVEGTGVSVFHPDVRVWEVNERSSGQNIGLWYLDPFARKGKQSGAWATSYRRYSDFQGPTNVLSSNNSNFIKAPVGEKNLVSWGDATTLFHEFGHALHYLSSNVAYPSLNGALRDYVEFQSQLLEKWLMTDEVISTYLVHYRTGRPMPAELVKQIMDAETFNQGFLTTEYLASAILDLEFHTTDPTGIDPARFERETLEAIKMPDEIVMRHRTSHFGHIFSGEGYAAGYYSYLWADVLTSDAAEAFAETPDGLYDKETASRLMRFLFSPQNSIDPGTAYRMFRGRDAEVDALMRDKGFVISPDNDSLQ